MNSVYEAELRWFFRWAEGELGLKSNLGPLLEKLELGVTFIGGGSVAPGIDERCLESVARERAVRRALAVLSPKERGLLYVMYGPEQQPRLPAWGRYTALVFYTKEAEQAWARDGKWLPLHHWLASFAYRAHKRSGMDPTRDVQCAARLRLAAERMWAALCQCYVLAREGVDTT